MKVLIRTAREFEMNEICSHLLIEGELKGDCFNCREIGLEYSRIKSCPKCETEFHYIASRKSDKLGIKVLNSLHKKRPDLICIEFSDIAHHKNREKARNLFS